MELRKEINELEKIQNKLSFDSIRLLKEVGNAFIKKYNSYKIYFDEEDPPYAIVLDPNYDDSMADAQISHITFKENGIEDIAIYIPSTGQDFCGYDVLDFVNLDYVGLINYIYDQIENGQFIPEKDL